MNSGGVTQGDWLICNTKAILSADCPRSTHTKHSNKVQGEIVVYVGDPWGSAAVGLAKGIVTAWTDSANVIPPGGKERSETPTSGVTMASQREPSVDFPMLASQKATNLNLQSTEQG